MSTNAQPRVLGRWCRTSRWCTLVHARRAFVAPADATSASCDVRRRDDSGRQRPRVAPSADRNVHEPRRLRSVTSTSRNVERLYVSERRDVSETQRRAPLRQRAVRSHRAATSRGPRRLRGVTSASRNVERCYVSERRDVSVPQRQSGALSASRNVKRATSSAKRQSAQTSAWHKAGLRCSWRRTRPFSRNDSTRHRPFKI